MVAVGRNDPCPCGSGKKYKKCCGGANASATAALSHSAQANSQSNSQSNSQPNPLQAYRNTAAQLQRAGQFPAAVEVYQKVVQLDNNDADAFYELGRLQGLLNPINSDGLREAIQCLKRAVAIRPNDLLAQLELAKLLAKNFAMQALIQSTERALQIFPDNIALMTQRGSALAYLDYKQDAIAILERANALEPFRLDTVTALASVYIDNANYQKAQSLLSNMLAQLESNAANNAKRSEHTAGIYYKLGSVEDKLANYSAAAKAIKTAGQIQLQSNECKSWDNSNGIQMIKDFTAEVVKPTAWAGVKAQHEKNTHGDASRLVFFVGFPRSGTTLTEQLLAAHTDIKPSEERVDLGYAIESLFNHHRSDYQRDAMTLFNQLSSDDIQLARTAYWQSVGIDNQQTGVYLDKLPLNINHIPWVQKIFPEAKLIVALRDPRDVCLSCYFQHFAPNVAMNHFLQWADTTRYYRYVMSQWLATKNQLQMDWIETRYEDTVADIESQARRLIDFIGLEWQPQVLSYREALNDRAVATPSNAAIRQPLNSKAVERWRNYPELTEAAAADLKPLVQAFGYQW